MITKELRRAWRFFQQHGASIVGRRAQQALDMARAERDGKDAGLQFVWEDDPYGWHEVRENGGVCSCGCGRTIETVESCVCYGPDGCVLAALGGVWDADDNYRRVVEATLAQEALAQLDYAI